MANEALESFRGTLIQILQRTDDLITPRVKLQIIRIHDKAAVLQLNLKHFLEEEEEEEEETSFIFMEIANTAAEIIQSFIFSPDCGLTEAAAVWQLEELAAELELTAGDVVDYISSSTSDGGRLTLPVELAARISNRFGRLWEKMRSTVSDSDEDPSTESAVVVGESSSPSAATTKDVDGFEEDLVHILDQLVSSSTGQRVLSIVGMAGIGKSRLAKIVYENAVIQYHFDIRAWITITQDSTRDSVVSNLLASLQGKTEQSPRGSQAEQFQADFQEVKEHLQGRRYLIVMDDVWSSELWDEIRLAFPDTGNGSRILLTTRLMDVAVTYFIHVVRFLDEQQSWDLFQREAFADQTCPLELQAAAKRIVQGCGGLPLSIVTKARFLSKIDKTPKMWQQIVANDDQLGTISPLSYNHLPHHLRPCFLYMAAFPGDYEIHASELIRLWIAEGFLERSNEYKSLEQVGEAYLEDLMDINLVLVTNKKIDGKIRACKLHSTVRDFCVRQAEQEKLLLPVMDYLPTPILRRHFLPKLLENHRRISASWYDLKDSMHSSSTHSIICIPQKGYKPKASVRNFTSLRVLHVLRRKDHSYWEIGQVFDLIYLKYLASYIPTSIVPPAISKLQNLQTLIIYRHEVRLPVEIWGLRQLRHLIAFSFYPLPSPSAEVFPLINLQTLYLAMDLVCSARIVEMIPNIKKLGICYYKEILDEGYCLDNLSHLFGLEKLKLERRSLVWLSLKPLFPQSLKKLTLSGWRLPWRDMAIVARLPHLQILKLRNYACDGQCWETTEGGFCNLRLLLIDESNLQHWNTESSHFPRLQSLMLHRCPYLHEIPDDIGDIATLELIEIDDRYQSLLYSAKRIQEEQQTEWGNDDLQVHAVRL